MSYFEISVGDRPLPMLFGLRSMKIAGATIIDREFLDTETFLINTTKSVLMAGHLSWCVENAKKPQFSHQEIYSYLESILADESKWKEVADALSAFNQSKIVESNGEEKKSLQVNQSPT